MRSQFKRLTVGTSLALGLVFGGSSALMHTAPTHAQRNVERDVVDEVLSLRSDVLDAIREARFSELFTVTLENGATGYGVKDKDYSTRHKKVGFYSLWGDVPEENVLQVAMFYCFRDRALANSELEKVILLNRDRPLVTLEQKEVAAQTRTLETSPARYERIMYGNPFYDPFWGSLYWGGGYYGYYRNVYIPASQCSAGGGRFDLLPVKEAIARLPNKTLKVQLVFSNGMVENWRLGKKTVRQLKNLPTLKSVARE